MQNKHAVFNFIGKTIDLFDSQKTYNTPTFALSQIILNSDEALKNEKKRKHVFNSHKYKLLLLWQ
jgi:hypothetical protein